MSDAPDLDILKSPAAKRMRDMVTEGFYDRSRIGLWIYEVIGREWDDMAVWAQGLRDEAFPQTCTWSIGIWEWVHGYVPDENLPLEYRRQRLLAKKLLRPPINPARIEAALSALTNCPVRITDPIAPYTFHAVVDESNGEVYDYGLALKMLCEIKPSHLSFRFESYVARHMQNVVHMGLHGLGAAQIYTCAQQTLPQTTQTELYVGVGIVGSSQLCIHRPTRNKRAAVLYGGEIGVVRTQLNVIAGGD